MLVYTGGKLTSEKDFGDLYRINNEYSFLTGNPYAALGTEQYVADQLARTVNFENTRNPKKKNDPEVTKLRSQFRKDFWGYRTGDVGENAARLFDKTKKAFTKQELSLYDTSNMLYPMDVLRTHMSFNQWEKWANLVNGGTGNVLLFDTETVGDATGHGRESNGIYGITEIGFTRRAYDNGNIVGFSYEDLVKGRGSKYGPGNTYTENIALGIAKNSREHQYLETALGLYRKGGWDNLTQAQKVSLQRASAYANADFEFINEGPFSGLMYLRGVSSTSVSEENIEQGISNLTRIWDQYEIAGKSDRGQVIYDALQASGLIEERNGQAVLGRAFTEGSDVSAGANVAFDLHQLAHEMLQSKNEKVRRAGQLFGSTEFSYNFADELAFQKTIAAITNIDGHAGLSVSEFLKRNALHESDSNSVESLMRSYGYVGREQMHVGSMDTYNEFDVGDSMLRVALDNNVLGLERMKTRLGIVGNTSRLKKWESLEGKALYFHHGHINKMTGLEFARIGAESNKQREVVQNISYAGQAWTVDPDHTGYVTMQQRVMLDNGKTETKDKRVFAVTLYDTADVLEAPSKNSRHTQLVLTADSEADMMVRLAQESSLIDVTDASARRIIEQRANKRRDVARREWDRMFSVNGASTISGKPSGGYAQLKDFLSEAGILGKRMKRPESILTAAEENNIRMSFYDAMAYPDLVRRFNTENLLVDNVVSQIESMYGITESTKIDANMNVGLTLALQRGYNAGLDVISSRLLESGATLNTEWSHTLSSLNNVDVLVAGEIMRINAASRNEIQNRLNSIFKQSYITHNGGIDRIGVMDTLRDLHGRGLINTGTFEQFEKRLWGSEFIAKNMYNELGEIASDIWYKRQSPEASLDLDEESLLKTYWVKTFGDKRETINDILAENGSLRAEVNEAITKEVSRMYALGIGLSDHLITEANIDKVALMNGYADKESRQIIREIFYGSERNRRNGILKKPGYTSFLFRDEMNDSMFLTTMPEKNVPGFLSMVAEGKFDTKSYKNAIASGEIFKYGAVVEIPHIDTFSVFDDATNPGPRWIKNHDLNPFGLGDIKLARISENQTAFVNPVLRTYELGGKLHATLENGAYDLATSWRKGFKEAEYYLDLEQPDFMAFSKMMKKMFSRDIDDLSGSSSYVTGDLFDDTAKRYMQWTPADFIQAGRIKGTEGLKEIFAAAGEYANDDLQTAMNIINFTLTEETNDNVSMQRLLRAEGFDDFYHTHLFRPINEDKLISDALKKTNHVFLNADKVMDKNLFELLLSSLRDNSVGEEANRLDPSLLNVVGNLNTSIQAAWKDLLGSKGYMYDVVDTITGVRQNQQGWFSIGLSAASFNYETTAGNTVRPLTHNAMRGLRIRRDALENSQYLGVNPVVDMNERNITLAIANSYDVKANNNINKMVAQRQNAIAEWLRDTDVSFSGVVRNMDQYSLQKRYGELLTDEAYNNFVTKYGNTLPNKEAYERAVKSFIGFYDSLQDDSSFIRPSVGEMLEDELPRGARKYKLKLGKIDIERTRDYLLDLVNNNGGVATIKRGDVIGYGGGNKPKARLFDLDGVFELTEANVRELLPEGLTEETLGLFPDAGATNLMYQRGSGDISGRKLIFGSYEKTMGQYARAQKFMNAIGSKDLATAQSILENMFDYAFGDDVSFVTSMGLLKHGASLGHSSALATTAQVYAEEGRLKDLVSFLMSDRFAQFRKNINGDDGGIKFAIDQSTKQILVSNEWAKNYNAFMEEFMVALKNTKDGQEVGSIEALNKEALRRIYGETLDASGNVSYINKGLMTIQIANVNEITGTTLRVDNRQEQVWTLGFGGTPEQRRKSMELGEEYRKLTRKYAQQYTGKSSSDSEAAQFFNAFVTTRNQNRIRAGAIDNNKVSMLVTGYEEMFKAYSEKGYLAKHYDNYVHLSIDDIVNGDPNAPFIPAGSGNSPIDMQRSPFFMRGKHGQLEASDWIEKQVSIEGGMAKYKKGLAIDLGMEVELKSGLKTNTIVLPLYDITEEDDIGNYFTQGTAGLTSRFLRRAVQIKKDVYKKYDNSGNAISQREAMQGEIESMMKQFAKNMSPRDKKGEIYKLLNTYDHPTSTGLQVVSSASGLTKSLAESSEYAEYAAIRNIIQNSMSRDGIESVTKDQILQYAKALSGVSILTDQIAEKIKSDPNFYDELTDVPEFIRKHVNYMDKSGKQHYGYVMSTSAQVFESMGLDFNQLSAEVIEAYETGNKIHLEGMDNLQENADFVDIIKTKRKEVINRLNEINNGNVLYYDTVSINTGNVTEQIKTPVTEFVESENLFGPNGQFTRFLRSRNLDESGKEIGPTNLSRAINEAIARENGNGSAVEAMYKAFGVGFNQAGESSAAESLGAYYLERFGVYGDLKRFPIFKNQGVSKILLDRALNNKTAKVYSMIYHYETNLDFDGDTEFVSLFLDGGSVAKTDTKLYQLPKSIYENFTEGYSREGTAEAIKGMDFLSFDALMATRAQNAALLRMYDVDAYNSAIEQYKANNASLINEIRNAEGVTDTGFKKTVEMLAMSSNEMHTTYSNSIANGMHVGNMIIQSIRTKRRNAEIGSISTPNYRMRDTFITMQEAIDSMEDSARKLELEGMWYDVEGGMFNMFSKKGGLMALMEQDVISAKSSENLLDLVPLVLYSKGMSGITHARKLATNYGEKTFTQTGFNNAVARSVEEIMAGAGSNVYKFLMEEGGETRMDAYAAMAGSFSYKQLSGIYDEISNLNPGESATYEINNMTEFTRTLGSSAGRKLTFTRDDAEFIEQMKLFRGVAELYDAPELENAVAISELFGKDSDPEGIYKAIAKLEGIPVAEARKLGNNGMVGEWLKFISMGERSNNIFSDAFFKKDNVYFLPGMVDLNVNKRNHPEYFSVSDNQMGIYGGEGKFFEVEYDTDAGRFKKTDREISYDTKQLARALNETDAGKGINQSISFGNLKGMSLTDFDNQLSNADYWRRVATIDALSGRNFERVMVGDNAKEFADIINIFKNASHKEHENIANTYSLLGASNQVGANGIHEEIPSLIRQINKEIAANPDQYYGRNYNDIFREKVISNINYSDNAVASKIYEDAYAAATLLPSNAGGTINSAIENVAENRYNVDVVRKHIDAEIGRQRDQLASIQKDPLVKMDAIDRAANIINEASSRADSVIESIERNYGEAVTNAQKSIYSLFGDTSEYYRAFDTMFALNDYSISNARVGFGRHIGMNFTDLGMKDIEEIMSASTEGLSGIEKHAVSRTQEMLNAFRESRQRSASIPAGSYLDQLEMPKDILDIKRDMSNSLRDAYVSTESTQEVEKMAQEYTQEITEAAKKESKSMMKKSLEEVKDKIFKNENIMKYGMAAAAIGIAMKVMHKKTGGSPLMPKEKHKEDEPGYLNNGSMQYGKITDDNIYVDRSSGLKFDVSARTASKMQALNAQQAQSMYGSRMHSLNVSQDTSMINNNWLANRFADLAE